MRKKGIEVDWHLTYRCNLSCAHCSVVDYRMEDYLLREYFPAGYRHELSYNELLRFIEIIERSSEFSVNLHFSPNVGESTLHRDFVKIWNYLADVENVELYLTSNGVLLHRMLNSMRLDALKNLIISVDGGNKESHEAMRGKGTFEETLKTIKSVDEIKYKDENFYLQINTVITRVNKDSLESLPHLFEDLSSENIILNILKLLMDTGNALKNKDVLAVEDKDIKGGLRRLVESLNEVNRVRKLRGKKPIKLRLELFTLKEQFELLRELSSVNYSSLIFDISPGWKRSCGAYNLKRIYVDPYGYLFPCLNFTDPYMKKEFVKYAGEIIPPNFVDREYKNFEDILQTPFFQKAREWIGRIYSELLCNTCELRNSCTVCPVYAYLRGVPDACKRG